MSTKFIPCTVWYKRDFVKGWEYNHLQYGFARAAKPTPSFPSQAGWLRGEWIGYDAWLTHDVPPKVVYYPNDGS